jgi:outer membrane cobalamin receptor
LQANYTRRLSRPWGGQLNSFKNITDSTNISYGNPELQPQYSNAYELNYIKNWENHTLSLSGYFRSTDDVIQRIRYREGNIMYSTDRNVTQSQSAGLEIVAKNKLTRAIDLTTTVNLFYYKLDGFNFMIADQMVSGESDEDFSWNARMIANIILPYSFSLQLTGNYNARQVVAQGYRKANYALDAGLRKSFWNKKLSLSVNARDILNSRRWKTITQTGDTRMESENWRSGRMVGLTLTYSFGNLAPTKRKPANRPMEEERDPSMMDEFGGEGGML